MITDILLYCLGGIIVVSIIFAIVDLLSK